MHLETSIKLNNTIKPKIKLVLRHPIYTQVLSSSNLKLRYYLKLLSNSATGSEINFEMIADPSINENALDQLLEDNQKLPGDELQKIICEQIILNLNDKKMLDESLRSLRKRTMPNVPFSVFKKALARLREIDDFDTGSYDFIEKLSLTLDKANFDLKLRTIILAIIQEIKHPSKHFQLLCEKIQQLNAAEHERMRVIFQHYQQYLNDQHDSPKTYITDLELINGKVRLTKDSQQVIDSLKFFHKGRNDHFLTALEHRFQSMKVITKVIFKIQKKIPEELFPLSQKDIAKETGLSESTISRLVNHATVHISKSSQNYLLNELLSPYATKDINGTPISQHTINQMLIKLIEQENYRKIYSDEELVNQINNVLKTSLTRRTITKYRKRLKIGNNRARLRILTFSQLLS